MSFSTPILFLIFNRPENTYKVFEAIRRARPEKLFIAADGPRPHVQGEEQLCQATRAVAGSVDWPCDVRLFYRESNLGCKRAVSEALDWFYSEVEEGIVLEDDCLPHPTFFDFCGQMLARYRHDTRIMMITGDNFQPKTRQPHQYSYYFSNYANIWGWATWKRAWKHYDVSLSLWPEIKEGNWHHNFAENDKMIPIWDHVLQAVYDGRINTWDYQWNFACKVQHGLSIVPNCNLISNIGFGEGATHTSSSNNSMAAMPTQAMEFPLRHPPFVLPDLQADRRLVATHYHHMRYMKVKQLLKSILPAPVLNQLKAK